MSADIRTHTEKLRRMAGHMIDKYKQAGLTPPSSLQRLPDDINVVLDSVKDLGDMLEDCKIFKTKPSDQAVSEILDVYGKLSKAVNELFLWLMYWEEHAKRHGSYAGFTAEEIKDTFDFISTITTPVPFVLSDELLRCSCIQRKRR